MTYIVNTRKFGEIRKAGDSCDTCRAQIEALTYAVGPWLVLALVVWILTSLGVRADDMEHAASMQSAQPQIERVWAVGEGR